ncbi:MAG: hypothetical protein KA175_12375 [Flavobacteriales bacterium]|nr:hypothetical protein [Flavobacteriales bacterium]MBP7407807.1 hypothetical protein [Flavobacteriales bacterium]
MIDPPRKRSEHRTFPGEKEITRFEMMRVFDGDEAWVRTLEETIFCTCNAPVKRLIAYKVFVNDLNDVVMRGTCSACGHLAARYAETGEVPELTARVKAVLGERKG